MMIKNNFLVLIFLMIISLVNAQDINIPDSNFLSKLLSAAPGNNVAFDENWNTIKIDINNDGKIQQSEALLVRNLYLDGGNIINIEGIEHFQNMNSLYCSNNQITTMKFENLPNLKGLDLINNPISSLDLVGLTNLENLTCNETNISELNLNGLLNFRHLTCYGNENLTSIYIKNNVANQLYIGVSLDLNLDFICVDAEDTFNGDVSSSTIDYIVTNCILSNNDISNRMTLELYPNPVQDFLLFNRNVKKVDFVDISGKKVKSVNGISRKLHISELKSGIYFLHIIDEDKNEYIKKIIKN